MTNDFPTTATAIEAGALGVADGLLMLIRESGRGGRDGEPLATAS